MDGIEMRRVIRILHPYDDDGRLRESITIVQLGVAVEVFGEDEVRALINHEVMTSKPAEVFVGQHGVMVAANAEVYTADVVEDCRKNPVDPVIYTAVEEVE